MIKYKQSDIGFTETHIDLHLNNDCLMIDIDFFINNYKISKIFKGKFFVKRLIKKVFKYKLKNEFVWKKNFWNDVEINECTAKITLKKNIKSLNQFVNILNREYSTKRVNDVFKYQKLISKGKSLGSPLYITGSCLNALGANAKKNEIYMLDGSRRLIASLLADIENTKLFLIKLNDE